MGGFESKRVASDKSVNGSWNRDLSIGRTDRVEESEKEWPSPEVDATQMDAHSFRRTANGNIVRYRPMASKWTGAVSAKAPWLGPIRRLFPIFEADSKCVCVSRCLGVGGKRRPLRSCEDTKIRADLAWTDESAAVVIKSLTGTDFRVVDLV